MSEKLKALATEAAVGHFFAETGSFTPDQVLEALANDELQDGMLLWEPFEGDALKQIAEQLENMIDWLVRLMERAASISSEEAPVEAATAGDVYPLTDAAYVAEGGGVCPACGSNQIEGDSTEIDGASATQEVSCLDCSASWKDFYKLAGYLDLDQS